MWPEGPDTRQEACVYVYKIGCSGWPSRNQRKLLPIVYPLALQSFTFLDELQTKMLLTRQKRY